MCVCVWRSTFPTHSVVVALVESAGLASVSCELRYRAEALLVTHVLHVLLHAPSEEALAPLTARHSVVVPSHRTHTHLTRIHIHSLIRHSLIQSF